MKAKIITKPNIIIFVIVALAFLAAYANQYYTAARNKGLKYEVFIEYPRDNYRRVAVSGLPLKHTFSEEHENIFIQYSSEKTIKNLKVSLAYRSAKKLKIWPFPETDPKHAENHIRTDEDTWLYETIDDVANNKLTYVIGAVPGREVELIDIKSKFITTPGVENNHYYQMPYFILLLLLALPLYWTIHARVELSQWFLVAVSALLLFLIDYKFLLILSILLILLYKTKRLFQKSTARRGVFLASVSVCLTFLAVFKYFPNAYYSLFFSVGAIPIGLSYFFFRMMHVVMEWYRGTHLDLNFRKFLCYLIFFPTIPAGPIETIDGFYAKRLEKIDSVVAISAVARIMFGFIKKAFIVNFLLSEILFNTGGSLYTHLMLDPLNASYPELALCLLVLLVYSYIDFSAYSDIAIGLGQLFGYRICENFNFPLFRRNTAEFWNNYHMSLGNWCRRNVYFPVLMTTRNSSLAVFLTFLSMGFWHHLSLNWGVWAIHQSLGVIWIMLLGQYLPRLVFFSKHAHIFNKLWAPVAVGIMIFYAAGSMSMIYIEDFTDAFTVYSRFFTIR